MSAIENTPIRAGDALLAVDVQNDFLPGGALGVKDGDQVVAPLNRWIARFEAAHLPIFFTRDWHPADHCSFKAQGGIWPPHCIAGTTGAQFSTSLAMPAEYGIVSKATRQDAEAYSTFAGTDLHERLQRAKVRRVFLGGLATDYCVVNSTLDARRLGYEVVVLVDAIRAVELHPGDSDRAIATMRSAGAELLEE